MHILMPREILLIIRVHLRSFVSSALVFSGIQTADERGYTRMGIIGQIIVRPNMGAVAYIDIHGSAAYYPRSLAFICVICVSILGNPNRW